MGLWEGGVAIGSAVSGTVSSVGSGGITATSVAADAIGASELAADAVLEIADGVWDEATAGHLTAGTYGAGAWQLATKTVIFTGAAGAGQNGGETAIFTVSGDIEIGCYYEKCLVNLAGAGAISTGTASALTSLHSATSDATTIDAGEWNLGGGAWNAQGAPGLAGPIANFNFGAAPWATAESIVFRIDTADITAGQIKSYVWWRPLSSGATLVAA